MLKTRRNGYMKVLASGRQGRPIFDELADVLPLPTVFEQAYPFEWPGGVRAIEAAPVVLALPAAPDDELIDLAAPEQEPLDVEEVRPPTDDELVDFWADQAEQAVAAEAAKPKKRGPDGRF